MTVKAVLKKGVQELLALLLVPQLLWFI